MKNKITENMNQIQGFADLLTEGLVKYGVLDSDVSMVISQQILEVLKSSQIPHQVEVVILLQLACAVFQIANEDVEISRCPSPYLN